ncbi:MAG: hypothetical protein IJP31_02270 [Lachnospiraceae bacterium]|nr:hypothetical protein [Lachnospiraceae bacterium]
MIASIVGHYLLEIGQITREQLHDLLKEQHKVRVKLGLIAVSEGLMTQEEAERVNRLQAIMDMRFGDIAVEERYLTEEQVEQLLKKQGNAYLSFAQALENQQIIKMEQLEQLALDFQQDRHYTDEDMETLKSGDIDRILRFYMPKGSERYEMIASTAVKTLMRLVDEDIWVKEIHLTDSWKSGKGSFQQVTGSNGFSCGLVGERDALAPIACIFGQEHFMAVDEDALDAVGELVNCINGLVATNMSETGLSTGDLELCPPYFSLEIGQAEAKELLVISMEILRQNVDFLISLGGEIKII